MSTPVNCGTSFCSCIECVVPLRTMTREELDTEIVVAISVFKAAKREELVQAAERSMGIFDAAWHAYMDVAYDAHAAGKAYAAWYAWDDALDALKTYDKENK